MNDDGYTLAEMLAALVTIALATGGLIEGTRVIGMWQGQAARAVGDGRSLRAPAAISPTICATANWASA